MRQWLYKKTSEGYMAYYERAARNGYAYAYANIGQLYEAEGKIEKALDAYLAGALQSDQACENYLKQFASLEMDTAEYYLGLLFEYRRDWKAAKTYYKKAIAHNHFDAMYKLACLYKSDRISNSNKKIIKKNTSKEFFWYRKAASYYNKYALNALVKMSEKEPEAALQLAELYENGDNNFSKNIDCAIKYYLLAAQNQQKTALQKLEYFFKTYPDKELAYQIGTLYDDVFAENNNALIWYLKSAIEGHQPAFIKLDKLAQKNIKIALVIAQHFDELPQTQSQYQDVTLRYYLMVSQHEIEEVLPRIKQLLAKTSDGSWFYKLAEIYQNSNRTSEAVRWYLEAAEKKYQPALSLIHKKSSTDATFLFFLAKVYEAGDIIHKDLPKAFSYYANSAYLNHADAKIYLISAAMNGIDSAQYSLGCEYYHKLKNFSAAIHWCMQAAEQGYLPAWHYLIHTDFSVDLYCEIADKYEKGDTVRQNLEYAIQFYEKAYIKGDSKAAYCLGNLYQAKRENTHNAIEKAFKYYLEAARKGNKDAFFSLSSLAEDVNSSQQQELASLYRFFSCNNKAAAMETEVKQKREIMHEKFL